MFARKNSLLAGLGLAVMSTYACFLFGGTGACVSTPVEFTFGTQVYCYSEWDKSECSDYDQQEVNSANWTFHSGQTCEDRDLTDGSNSIG